MQFFKELILNKEKVKKLILSTIKDENKKNQLLALCDRNKENLIKDIFFNWYVKNYKIIPFKHKPINIPIDLLPKTKDINEVWEEISKLTTEIN